MQWDPAVQAVLCVNSGADHSQFPEPIPAPQFIDCGNRVDKSSFAEFAVTHCCACLFEFQHAAKHTEVISP